MSVEWALPAERCRDELRAARSLLDAGLPAQAVSRTWFAVFHAAGAALAVVDERPSSPTEVVSAFARTVSGNGLAPETGRTLRKLFEDHKDVDYALAGPAAGDGERALADAQRFVDETTRWIEARFEAD
ncbi:MAG TPA: HEPN domain-containing protein [Thermoleophilaceae bacterium]|jgi:uncharacterized protein (UPF0332 family)